MNIGRITAIVCKDFLEALRNKTVLIAVLLPLVASLFLAAVDNPQQPQMFLVGVTGSESRQLTLFLKEAAADAIVVSPYRDAAAGKEAVTQGQIHALIVAEPGERFIAYLDGANPMNYFPLKDVLQTVLSAYKGRRFEPVVDLVILNQGKTSTSLLPLWLTVTAVMIGVMVLSGSFAEEKEKGTLDSIRVSSAVDGEILLGKGIFGTLLVLVVSSIMLWLNKVELKGEPAAAAALLLILGAVSFTAIGLIIGLHARSQSAARAISTLVYLPLIFPAVTADLSPITRRAAEVLPSFYLYRGLRKALQYQADWESVGGEILPLAGFALVLSLLTLLAYRRTLDRER
ncbi:MAG TPA: ABC transporter permease [Firmicutes bacterium]|nr:ABC transporter permease [Bacillota bacterium]